jgi:hypothetical protein
MDPNQLQENPLDEKAKTLGQNTPLTPVGASDIGATPKQMDMAGSLAQRDAQLKKQQEEQQKRLQEQQKQAEIQQQQLAGTTLAQAERYETPTQQMSQQQAQAQATSESLRAFGPVQTKIQGLIQQKLGELTGTKDEAGATVGGTAVGLAANTDEISKFPNADEVEDAVDAYIKAPSEKTIKGIYDAAGRGATETISDLFLGAGAAFDQAAQAVMATTSATLGSLALDIDDATKQELANALGLANAAALDGLTIDQLEQEIQALEAQEYSQIAQLEAVLADPTASPSLRAQAREQLAQLGAVGVVEAEQRVGTVIDQVESGNTIEIMGREFTLEQALGDEGISDLISEAVLDEDLLQDMLDSDNYKGLGQWIVDNKAELEEAVGEAKEGATSFIEVQDEYQGYRTSFGESDAQKALFDKLFPGYGSSILSTDRDTLAKKMETNPIFSTLKDDKILSSAIVKDPALLEGFMKNLGEGEDYEELVAKAAEGDEEAKTKLESLATTMKNSSEIANLDETDIGLVNPGLSAPLEQGKYITDQTTLDAAVKVNTAVQSLNSGDKQSISELMLATTSGILGEGEEYAANLVAFGNLPDGQDKEDTVADFKAAYAARKNAPENSAEIKKELAVDQLSWIDFNYYLRKKATPEQKEFLIAVFDGNGDGVVSSNEYANPIVDKYMKALGLNLNAAEIISGNEGKKELDIGADAIDIKGTSIGTAYANAATTAWGNTKSDLSSLVAQPMGDQRYNAALIGDDLVRRYPSEAGKSVAELEAEENTQRENVRSAIDQGLSDAYTNHFPLEGNEKKHPEGLGYVKDRLNELNVNDYYWRNRLTPDQLNKVSEAQRKAQDAVNKIGKVDFNAVSRDGKVNAQPIEDLVNNAKQLREALEVIAQYESGYHKQISPQEYKAWEKKSDFWNPLDNLGKFIEAAGGVSREVNERGGWVNNSVDFRNEANKRLEGKRRELEKATSSKASGSQKIYEDLSAINGLSWAPQNVKNNISEFVF